MVQKETYMVPADIEFTYCPNCSIHQQYFEGVLQLRNPHDEVINYVRNEVMRNKDRGAFITKEVMHKKGMDFYISKQHFIQNLAKGIQKKFGGKVNVNPELFSRDKQKSRDLYRMNILVELPLFKKGDIVKIDKSIINIKKMGKTITGEDLVTRKSASFDYPQKKAELLEKKTGIVSKNYPHLEIIDPESYQSVKPENSKDVKINEKVRFVMANGKIYII